MDAAEQLKHIRELGKVRAKKHYDAHKAELNAKRRARYAKKKAPHETPVVNPVINGKEYTWSDIIGDGEKVVDLKKKTPQVKKVENIVIEPVPDEPPLTLAIVQQKIKDLNIEKKSSETKYLDDIKRVMKMTGCKNLIECLSQPKLIIKMIEQAKMRNGELYSINTKKSAYQSILFVIDKLKLKLDKKLYNEQFEIYKIKSLEQTSDRVENQAVPLWKDYLKKCRAKYGMDSREYLITRMYNEFCVRDDYGLVLSDDSNADNYLFVRPDYLEVVINSYKTDKKYGQIRYKLKPSLEKLTREYIANNKLKIGDLLFGKTQLSPIVSKMNKELGYYSGTNLFRHMSESEELEKAKTPEQRVKIAEAFKHSPVVSLMYLRKKKLI